MSWGDLADGGLVVRPWSGARLPRGDRIGQFRAPLGKTVRLLAREVGLLSGEQIVIELDIRERDLRLDGYPRHDARQPEHPGVGIYFDSRHGPLHYATAEFRHWDDNLRAIALALEALRAVDRYGVSRSGEQYRGWRAIPASTGGDPGAAIHTAAQAAQVIVAVVGDLYDVADVLDDGSAGAGAHEREAVREAMRRTHPDRGGDADDFRRVMRAREVLSGKP